MNMPKTSVSGLTKVPQGHKFCRNEAACKNIPLMSPTLPTAHADRSLLNSCAIANIRNVFVTCATFQADRSEEKDDAPAN